MEVIDVTGLKQCLETNNELVLLDVREPWEFDICHIAGSVNIPMSRIVSNVNELDRSATIIVICHHGTRSHHVGNFLENSGFEHIINLDGGVNAWAEQIDLQMPRY